MTQIKRVLRTETEWRLLGRFVKQKATPFMRCQSSGEPLYHENQTFTVGDHPHHVPNYIGGENDSA